MHTVKTAAALGMAAMAAAIVYGFAAGSFSNEGGALLAMPWGRVTLIDLSVGFVIFLLWIGYREASPLRIAGWALLMLCLGNLASCFYLWRAAAACRGDWNRFFHGSRRMPGAPGR